jgi:hypothetical protein
MKVRLIAILFVLSFVIIVGCADKPPTDLVFLKDSLEIKFAKFPTFYGVIKNQGKNKVQLRSISFTIWEDANREYIKDAGIAWFARYIKPDQTATIEVSFPDLKTNEGLSVYTYEIRWFDRKKNKIFSRSLDS